MAELLNSGLELMMLGMGIVFVFLTILVFTLKGMCALAAYFEKDTPAAASAMSSPITVTDEGANDPAMFAAITAAVTQFRATR